MRPSTVVFALSLLAVPLALITEPGATGSGGWLSAQNTLQAPPQTLNGRPTTPAPTSDLPPMTLSPADRVAGPGLASSDAGPTNATPFSAAPTGTLSGGSGQRDSHARAGVQPDTDTTPNLGK